MNENFEVGARYRIIRQFQDRHVNGMRGGTLLRGLTLEEAQAHCRNPESSSTTCTHGTGRARTRKHGPWFDAYDIDREK